MGNRSGFEPGAANSMLAQIHEDMEVYDSAGERVGRVEAVQLAEADTETLEQGAGPATAADEVAPPTWLASIAETFDTEGLPETVRDRLMRHGFIRVDAPGLFSSDRYIMPDQIAGVSGGRVTLSVRRDDLVKERE